MNQQLFNKIQSEFMGIYEDSYLKSIIKTTYHQHHRDSKIECEYIDPKTKNINKVIHIYSTKPIISKNTIIKTYGKIPRKTDMSQIIEMRNLLKKHRDTLTEQQVFDLNFIIHCITRGIRI